MQYFRMFSAAFKIGALRIKKYYIALLFRQTIETG